jgi:drug/metabolite transporter (DMT)-like permease
VGLKVPAFLARLLGDRKRLSSAPRMSIWIGMLLGVGASVCWALANVAVQRASTAIGPYRALLWAQVVGILGVLPFLRVPAAEEVTASTLAWIAGAGVVGLLAYTCMFYAFAHGRLTLAVPIMSSWAVLASALGLTLFGQRLRPLQLVGAAAVIAGAVVVGRHAQREAAPAAGGTKGETPRWLLAAIGAACGFGVLIPAMGRLTPLFGSTGAIAVAYGADLAVGLPLAAAARISLAPPPLRVWPAVAFASLFETAGFACITEGGRRAPLAVVSPLASLASALTVLYAWAILRERPSRGVLAGAALVCAGVVVLAL